MRKYFPEMLFSIALLACILLSLGLGNTQNEQKVSDLAPKSFKDYFLMRRNHFFGHKELSDTLSGLSILAATVDVYSNYNDPNYATSKVKLRFDEALKEVPYLSQFAIGMNDIYILPAVHFAFTEENPERALELVELGMKDSRTNVRVPLLGGFLSHVFDRNLQRAGMFYKHVAEKYSSPAWINELADRLLAGEDPYLTNPKLRGKLEKIINVSFPRAKGYFERHNAILKGGNPQ
jgi:hypothetical protein